MTVLEKLSAARDKFFRENGYLPNTVKMNMGDYRALCELGDPKFLAGMNIQKRQGEMECGYCVAENSIDAVYVGVIRDYLE